MTRPYQTTPNGMACNCGDHVFAVTSRWGVVLVSPQDANFLTEFVWTLVIPKPEVAYAKSMLHRKHGNAAGLLHKALLPGESMIDHVNGNGLDDRRHNIRPSTRAQNRANVHRPPKTKSGYRGVYFNSSGRGPLWKSSIKFNKKSFHLGYFDAAIDAAKAYDEKAAELFGNFAALNFPLGCERGLA
jgi:hypothetical protein